MTLSFVSLFCTYEAVDFWSQGGSASKYTTSTRFPFLIPFICFPPSSCTSLFSLASLSPSFCHPSFPLPCPSHVYLCYSSPPFLLLPLIIYFLSLGPLPLYVFPSHTSISLLPPSPLPFQHNCITPLPSHPFSLSSTYISLLSPPLPHI